MGARKSGTLDDPLPSPGAHEALIGGKIVRRAMARPPLAPTPERR